MTIQFLLTFGPGNLLEHVTKLFGIPDRPARSRFVFMDNQVLTVYFEPRSETIDTVIVSILLTPTRTLGLKQNALTVVCHDYWQLY